MHNYDFSMMPTATLREKADASLVTMGGVWDAKENNDYSWSQGAALMLYTSALAREYVLRDKVEGSRYSIEACKMAKRLVAF